MSWSTPAVVGDKADVALARHSVSQFHGDTGWEKIYFIENEIEVKARRVGKMVTLIGFSWGYVSLPAKQTRRLTTLPAKFRPSWSVPFNIATMGGEESFSESSEVGTDGVVSIYVTKAGISYWKFSVSYPVA